MSRAENEAYWGSTDTAPSALDNFFDEDSNVSWTGYAGGYLSQSSKTAPCNGSGNAVSHGGQPVPSCTSITDNITIHSVTDRAVVDIPGTGNNSEKLSKGVGKAIGEKLDSWKPPSVSIKWNSSQGQGNGYCVQCSAKDNEISQLKKRLENSYSRYNLTLPPDDTVTRILLGQPYSLECYRSHEDKLALLDAALNTMDGSAILATVLHMKNTVKKSLFIKEMQERPHATQLYVTYLKKRHNYAEAIDFLRLLGKPDDAAILAYEFALTSRAPEVKVKNMRKTLDNSFTDPNLSYEAKIVKENIKLLERQMAIDETDHNDLTNPMLTKYPRAANIVDKSLLTTLYYCCMYHWDSVESHAGSPMALRKAHSFTDHQVLWTILRGRARVNHWPLPNELDSWLGSKGLLGALGSITSAFSGAGKAISTLKSTLPIEQVVHTLSASGAPANVLAVYLALIDSIDTRLKLAMNYKCHQGVIDAYISQKDRDALEKYMHEIPAGSPEYLKAENALKSAKWKN
ncbi:spermatogenesis-defective protein 39 homolog [Homarus americanus]|uniref:spermatogenesis-defective protein 39 homolog n=1 Tax=Homarus americanus TaxID=6706 RepID=UPI001C46CF2B|nr:spermatogenesis-defective protein 39 homolog [Homarus americanus]XP_042237958.1 spermatogenesis-defective protein 39 homolog [Homarus americanus]XP_042237966.1 spermatogenesis-defective protein 39 homolog [Homarus americanus]